MSRPNAEAVKITIQLTDGVKVQTLHYDRKEIPNGMTLMRCVSWMLARAAEKFQDPPPPVGRVD